MVERKKRDLVRSLSVLRKALEEMDVAFIYSINTCKVLF